MRSSYRVLYYPLQLFVYLLIVYGLFSLCRLAFFSVNQSSFPATSGLELGSIFLAGLRFDTSAIVYINALFILSFLLPFSFRNNKIYRNLQFFLFLFFNFFALLLELIDVGFFSYSFKRSASSDLTMIANSFQLTPRYLLDYWYLMLLFFLIIAAIFFLYQKVRLPQPSSPAPLLSQLFVFLVGIPILILAARGGWQLRPLSPIVSTEYVSDMRLAPLVSNTTLNIIFSTQQRILKVPPYFSADALDKHYPISISPALQDTMRQKNVVVIVLESFGEEQVGYFNPGKKSNTPFLDSLLSLGWMPQQGLANGLRSTQGIVAITTGIPSLMEDPLMFSAYQSNRLPGLAHYLKAKGYQTGFFHGCNPGSMQFESFAQLSGFEHFYDKTEYNNEADYDNNWGIWDIPFFQFFAQTIDAYEKPFLGLIFSLTSHHPYAVEASFAQQYPDMAPVERSYLYTDAALRAFFDTIKTKDWYSETVFLLTADHVGPNKSQDGNTKYSRYQIPICIFDPNADRKLPPQPLMQQVDILPSLLDYIGYDAPYSSFGQSVFDTLSPRYSAVFAEGLYQLSDQQHLLLFDGQQSTALYNHQTDLKLERNLVKKEKAVQERMEIRIKAMIQRHHEGMVRNRLVIGN